MRFKTSPVGLLVRALRPSSMRGTLLLLLAILMLPVLLVQGVVYDRRFEARRAEEYRANLEVAHGVVRAFEAYLNDVLHQQAAVGRVLTARGSIAPEDARALLRASAVEYPSITAYSWLDPRGTIIVSSDPAREGVDVSDRQSFREIVAGRPWAVNELVPARFTGEAMFVIARGVRDGDGVLRGVVSATVDPRRLGTALRIPREQHGAIAIIDRNGRGVYRYPEVELTWAQRDWLTTQPIIGEALRGREVTGTFRSVFDGSERMAGFAPIPSIGWVAGANRPASEVLTPILWSMLRHFGLLVLAAACSVVAALVLGRRLTRSMRRLQEHAASVGRGEFTRPLRIAHPAELRATGEAFDRMAAEIQRQEEQRKRMLATIAHELRGPLAPLRHGMSVLERSAPDAPEGQQALQIIRRQVGHITRLIEDLLDIQRMASDKLRLRVERTELNAAVRAAAEEHRAAFRDNGIELAVFEADRPLYVDADPSRLTQVIGNLLQNSAKFTPRGGRTVLQVAAGDGQAIVQVSDNGIGIAPEALGRIFEPFAQLEQTPRGSGTDGLGLGLALVKSLVEMHGGSITAESDGPGKGTRFTVRLPSRLTQAAAA